MKRKVTLFEMTFVAGAVLAILSPSLHAGNPGGPGSPYRFGGGYSDFGLRNFSAADVGYNLDDPHPGYYGGANYREYYNFGRGYGLANYPGPYPGPAYRSDIYAPPMWFSPAVVPHVLSPEPEPVLSSMPNSAASLIVEVPADAEIWLDGVQTRQTGANRTFLSPPLTPGKDYTYEIRARWQDSGRKFDQTRNIVVRSGEKTNLHFPAVKEPEALKTPNLDTGEASLPKEAEEKP